MLRKVESNGQCQHKNNKNPIYKKEKKGKEKITQAVYFMCHCCLTNKNNEREQKMLQT